MTTHTDQQFLQQEKARIIAAGAAMLDEMFGTHYRESAGVRIYIHGSVSHEAYDHAPGIYFYTHERRGILVNRYSGMTTQQVQELALAEYQKFWDLADEELYEEGRFAPSCIRIESYGGEVIDVYEHARWMASGDDLIPRHQWDCAESRIKRLRAEASYEAGWADNFDSARDLRKQARCLEDRLNLSRQRHQIADVDEVIF